MEVWLPPVLAVADVKVDDAARNGSQDRSEPPELRYLPEQVLQPRAVQALAGPGGQDEM